MEDHDIYRNYIRHVLLYMQNVFIQNSQHSQIVRLLFTY